METTNAQQALMECLTGLLRDPMQALEYAKNPRAFLDDKMGEADLSDVNMPAAVEQAAMDAGVSPEMAEAVQAAVYQPAPMIRVPAPTDPAGDSSQMRPEDGGYDKNVDRNQPDGGDQSSEMKERAEPRMDDGGMDQRPEPRMEDRRVDEPTTDADPADMDAPAPAPDGMMDDARGIPEEYQPMDGGGYCATAPEGLTPDTYSPDTYTPTVEVNMECVEYSVSNCVTTKYQDTPEVSEQLCHTRSFEDPYDRLDPSHDYTQVNIVQNPDYEFEPVDVRADENGYDDGEYGKADPYDAEYKYDGDEEMPVDNGDTKYANDDDYGNGRAEAPAPVENGKLDEYGGGDKQYEADAEKPVEYDAEPAAEYQAPEPDMGYQEAEYVEPEPVAEYAEPMDVEPAPDYPEPDGMDDDMMVDG
ncbi:MAG: hypothetical protein AB8G26_12140 [Ilumatobacter sp.]